MAAINYESLNIRGFGGQTVPSLLLKQQQPAAHLALIFPGYNYNGGMPLLYYSGLQLLERGADVLRVEYTYSSQPGFAALPDAEKDARIHADAAAALDAALGVRAYTRVTLVGKSIGTRAMGEIIADPRLAGARCVWLTPLLKSEGLFGQIEAAAQPGMFVMGSADPLYHPARFANLSSRPACSGLVIPGADHSLEIPGDFWASFAALQRYLRALEEILS